MTPDRMRDVAELLSEAAGCLMDVPAEVWAVHGWRQPLPDELIGFAAMLRDEAKQIDEEL